VATNSPLALSPYTVQVAPQLHLTLPTKNKKKKLPSHRIKEKKWQDATISNSAKSLYPESPPFLAQPPTHASSTPDLTTTSSKTEYQPNTVISNPFF
jgi:hypothetical protein